MLMIPQEKEKVEMRCGWNYLKVWDSRIRRFATTNKPTGDQIDLTPDLPNSV